MTKPSAKYESVKVDDLTPDPSNVRSHSDRNLQAITNSLLKFGQQKPIVVDGEGVVVAGNGTLEAAKALGWDFIDIVRTSLTGAEAVAFAIADNRSAELAEWDGEALAKTLEQLQADEEIDEIVAGFTADEIANVVGLANWLPPESADGKEFDESCADGVKFLKCPKCDHEFPV